jgi:hypothetical protein
MVVERVRRMSVEDFRESLIRAGIIGRDGKLDAKYKR